MGTDRQGGRSPLRRRPLIASAGRLTPRPARRVGRLALAAALLAGAALWRIVPPAAAPAGPDATAGLPGSAPAVVRGSLHIHSVRSDGGGTVAEIAAAASRAGLDFLVLTDHGDGTRAPAAPAYRSGVLCLDGVEISTDGGHYLALGLPRAPYPLGGDAAGVVEDVARLGGFGIVAHPASPKPELAWRDWSLPVDGVEWLNADSQWRDEGLTSLAAAVLGYGFRPPESLAAVFDRPAAALSHWDLQTARRRVVGLAGSDAHARVPIDIGGGRGFGIPFPTYETLFRAFSVHVELGRAWSGDPRADAEALLDAVRAGRLYTVIDALGELAHFRYRARSGEAVIEMGERVVGTEPVALEVSVGGPPGREIVLLRQGRAVARSRSSALRFEVAGGAAPAAYRAEVGLDGAPGTPPVPWIVSNPIYVGAGQDPVAESRPAAVEVDGLDVPGGWRAEWSDDSEASVEQVGNDVLLRFRLGGGPGRFASAAYGLEAGAVPPDVSFLFEAAASRPLRASVQLRSAGEADRGWRWRRSFHAGVAPATVRVDLGDLAPVEPAPRRPTASVDSLLVVVDATNTAAGTSGVLTLGAPRLVRASSPRPRRRQVRAVSRR